MMAVRFVPEKNVYSFYERNDGEKMYVRKHEAFVHELSTMVDDKLVGDIKGHLTFSSSVHVIL
jgi:hypothetical protein